MESKSSALALSRPFCSGMTLPCSRTHSPSKIMFIMDASTRASPEVELRCFLGHFSISVTTDDAVGRVPLIGRTDEKRFFLLRIESYYVVESAHNKWIHLLSMLKPPRLRQHGLEINSHAEFPWCWVSDPHSSLSLTVILQQCRYRPSDVTEAEHIDSGLSEL